MRKGYPNPIWLRQMVHESLLQAQEEAKYNQKILEWVYRQGVNDGKYIQKKAYESGRICTECESRKIAIAHKHEHIKQNIDVILPTSWFD